MSSIHLSDSDEDHKGRYRDSEDEVFDERQEDSEAYVHLAVVGFPNVGKSSLLNCIRGTKVVSVSQTAGHTKHVQTIPMPEDGITLIDSPGLAFPLLGLPPPLQAVIGTHQIAQVRDPMSGVAYLASHLPLERIYHLRPVDSTADDPKVPVERL
ncbi:hypothetical protein AGDE_12617 [Angomonas deanei]|uniref:Guanine nucleotide-binding protein-like 1 n=1 Tax=Angomonas deanei TaxID=59799 RepID=A0A7G2C685_9TRYP|nr:hypothetical protein AGDE_12617 [Angomonas deanei]CAD2215069.1 Ferrous iron transport protein B/50S ribosome-binding GTPase, putative [Angomonas deanei]|eukprot:EPY23942.1 hypothetical protein AGDE_12617 [Angomonas deanei]